MLNSVAAVQDDLPACGLYPPPLVRVFRLVIKRDLPATQLVPAPAAEEQQPSSQCGKKKTELKSDISILPTAMLTRIKMVGETRHEKPS